MRAVGAGCLLLAAACSAGMTPRGGQPESCGTFVVREPDDVPESARICFASAVRERRVVTLTVRMFTIEGDPLLLTYTSRTDGRVNVRHDASQDRFSDRSVTTRTCDAGSDPGSLEFPDC